MTLPICIDTIRLAGGARIGMTACPGRWRMFGSIVTEPDGLAEDIGRIRCWGASVLVSLMERDELRLLGIENIGQASARAQLVWYHCPIPDSHPPDAAFEAPWRACAVALNASLDRGETVVLHCLAGMGRTGTIAARLLVERGAEPCDAVSLVRSSRPGAIESPEQERYVLERRWRDYATPGVPALKREVGRRPASKTG